MMAFLFGPSFHAGSGSWAMAPPEKKRSRLKKNDFMMSRFNLVWK
jgi:hypothetical protein